MTAGRELECKTKDLGGEQHGSISLEPYRERLTYVAELAIELNDSVGFGVSSQDLEVFTAQTGEVFDRRSMYDFWSDPVRSTNMDGEQRGDIVVGCCALGLKRKRILSDSCDDYGIGLVLLPASVVLQSVMQPDISHD